MSIFTLVFATIFIAEMGDKTQLLLIAMTSKYKVRDILIGTWAATAVLNLLAVVFGAALSNYLDMRIIKTVAALAFFFFAYTTLKGGDDDEEEEEIKTGKFALTAIFTTFFIGELGDKTQLSGIALAATYTEHSLMNAAFVFAGCTLGLIAADLFGLIAGLVFKSKLPEAMLNRISVIIFTAFGIMNTYAAGQAFFGENSSNATTLTAVVTLIYFVICAVCIFRRKPAAHTD